MTRRPANVPDVAGVPCRLERWSVVFVQQRLDARVGDRGPSVQALGVLGHEDLDTVAGAFRDLRRVDAGVEPGGQRRVAQVVRAAREWRVQQPRRQRQFTGFAPDEVVRAGGEDASALGEEQSPVIGGAEGLNALSPQRHQTRW